MKTRYKILIIVLILTISIIASIAYDQPINRNTSSHFNYKDTQQIIEDTYLNKTVSEWQNESFDSIMAYYDIHDDDSFFTKLGALVIKNEMVKELNKQNIQAGDFKVYPGMVLTSLPPHVSFGAFVNSTDGNTYRLGGMTQMAKVNHPVHITKLQFFDTSVKLPLESILSQSNTIIIKPSNGSQSRVYPSNLIIYGNQDITVNFQNNNLVPIGIQGGGDHRNPNWYGPIILPLTSASMIFDKPGVYEWHARTIPLPGSIASDYMGGGQINIIGDDTSESSLYNRLQIGKAILSNSEIPLTSMGLHMNEKISMSFNRGIFDVLPNASEYYQARAEQLIPFDVPMSFGGNFLREDK